MSSGHVLIVESDFDGARELEAYLGRDGFKTLHAADGHQALEYHARWRPDLVLLGTQLPGLNGNEVLCAIRQHALTPIIMVASVRHEPNCINSLLYGADDYVFKPCSPGQMVARVHAVLRRWRGGSGKSRLLRHGRLVVDLSAAMASLETDDAVQPLELTRTEFNLLSRMMAAPFRMHTRAELMASCLPASDAMERVVDAHLHNLRRKLGKAGIHDVLVTARGLGYRFRNPS